MDYKEFALQFKEVWELAMAWSKKARREGLLALEDELDEEKAGIRDIVHFGLRFVVDGTDYEVIDKILTNLVNLETDEYVKTLKTIQKEAVLGIQSDMNPRVLAHLLNSYVDNEIAGVFEEEKNIKPLKDMANGALSREEQDAFPVESLSNGDKDSFSQIILFLDDRSVQKLFREIDSQELVKALKGCSKIVMKKTSRNLPLRAFQMLKEDMEYMGPVRLRDAMESRKKILSLIKNLVGSGEIVMACTSVEEWTLDDE